jgi:hypothetical protein
MRQSHPPWQRRGQRFRFCDLGLHARENEKTAQHDKKAAYPQADGANEAHRFLPENSSRQAGTGRRPAIGSFYSRQPLRMPAAARREL